MKVVHWFRFGLRLHDNPALLNAVKWCADGADATLINVYVFDPDVHLNPSKVGVNRYKKATLTALSTPSQNENLVNQSNHFATI